jgi:N-acetylmuramic acid 6-phosphate etherase
MIAGSAAKMALSLLSTTAMLQLGRVQGGLMIDLAPTSHKLRGRALRIVMDLADTSAPSAEAALAASGWRVRAALAALARGSDSPLKRSVSTKKGERRVRRGRP